MSAPLSNMATRRQLQLVMKLAGHSFEGLALATIARNVNQNAPVTLKDLQVLESEGYVERIPGRETFWRLSPRLVQVAIAHQAELSRLEQSVESFTNRYSRTPN